jgi:hypothetical protein
MANEKPLQHAKCMRGCMFIVDVCTVVGGEAALWMIAGPSFSNIVVSRKEGVVVNHVITIS